MTFRYQLWDNSQNNPNVGQFTLPSAAYNYCERYQSLQVSDAQVINEKAVTEVRFRYSRDAEHQTPASSQPAISVSGRIHRRRIQLRAPATPLRTSYELQDYTSVTLNKNFLKFGARLRDEP